jgi:uncharacterized protein YjbI with pentapeptide repeats
LSYTNLTGAKLIKSNFSGARLHGAILNNATIENSLFINALLSNVEPGFPLRGAAKLNNSQISNSKFMNANLFGAQMVNSGIINSDFSRAKMQFANLSQSEINNSKFYETNLKNSEMIHVFIFRNSDFSRAKMQFANLSKSDISNSKFYQTNLEKSDMFDATLTNSDFSYALITSANHNNELFFSSLENMNFRSTVFYKIESEKDAYINVMNAWKVTFYGNSTINGLWVRNIFTLCTLDHRGTLMPLRILATKECTDWADRILKEPLGK